MNKLILVIAIAACGGGAASKPPPSNVAGGEPPPAAPNPARKWGYPTDAECGAAIEHMMKTTRTNADAANKMAAYGDDAKLLDEGVQECRRKWMLGQIDCVSAATTFDALDGCMSMSYEVPDGVDVSTAPGRATPTQCKAALDRMTTIAPRSVAAETTDQCLRYWRPFVLACVMAATTKDTLATCFN